MPLRIDRLEPRDAFPEIAERFLEAPSYHSTLAERAIDMVIPTGGLKTLSYAEALWTTSWKKYRDDLKTLRGMAKNRAVLRR